MDIKHLPMIMSHPKIIASFPSVRILFGHTVHKLHNHILVSDLMRDDLLKRYMKRDGNIITHTTNRVCANIIGFIRQQQPQKKSTGLKTLLNGRKTHFDENGLIGRCRPFITCLGRPLLNKGPLLRTCGSVYNHLGPANLLRNQDVGQRLC